MGFTTMMVLLHPSVGHQGWLRFLLCVLHVDVLEMLGRTLKVTETRKPVNL